MAISTQPHLLSRARGGGLGSNIFNRNERLDVKKPGPFFKNSANNFFLDKVRTKPICTVSPIAELL